MPITIVDPRGAFVKMRMEKSPVVVLETDADTVEALPGPVRSAANCSRTGDLHSLRSHIAPSGFDAVLTWLAGDTILSGSPAAIRHDLHVPGRCTYVPVHMHCLDEVPLIALQPRWFRSGDQEYYWNMNFRIQSTGCASLVLIETLVKLWERAKQLPPCFAALVLRNLAVLMLRHGETIKAERFLEAGMKMYPGYAELFYLAALQAIGQQRTAQAFPLLEQARLRNDRGFLGCGGESSYRVDWLMGSLAARVGDERTAFANFL